MPKTIDIIDFDLNSVGPDFYIDPFPTYRALRERSPVHRNPDGSFFLNKYEHVRRCFREPQFSSDKKIDFLPKFGAGTPLYVHHTTSLVFNDDPGHARVRKLMAAAFTPRQMAHLRPIVENFIDNMLDRLAGEREFDVIDDYALKLPTEIVANMLGVPEDKRHLLHHYSELILGALDPVVSPENMAAGHAAVEEFGAELEEIVAKRRENPNLGGQGEVLVALIFGEVDGEKLSDLELIQNCIFLLNAGHETTANTVGAGIDMLLDNPAQKKRLLDNSSLIDPLVEETLRYQSPLQIAHRKALTDVEFDGVKVPAGTFVHMCIAGANRDPDVFAEPEKVDIGRDANPHLAFGLGKHICMGNTLGRIEGTVAIGRFFEKFPHVQRNGDAKLHGRVKFRGLRKFPVRVP